MKVSSSLGNIFILCSCSVAGFELKCSEHLTPHGFWVWEASLPFGKSQEKKKQLLYYLSKPKSKLQIHFQTLMLKGWKASREMEL